MAKKKTAAKSTELDAKEFFAAINDIEKERGIPKSIYAREDHPGAGGRL